jgi:hypothetical protein
MVVAEGIAALSSLRSLYEIARDVRNSNDPERLRAAAGQMFDLAFAAREQVAALQEERNAALIKLASLETEIEKAKRFDDHAENYARELTTTGAFVYREKESPESQGPSPYYCPHCFSNKRLSMLNPSSATPWEEVQAHRCPACNAMMQLQKLTTF